MPGGVEKHLEVSARIIKLALAFYRKEQMLLPDAEHTESMLTLLRLANGDAELMAWARQLTGASESELHLASVAFIEHVFFTVATDHFGVLGLNPWANAADVKEHYRLLMRLFHPDRGLVNSARADKYAAMINQAYAALKQEIPATPEVAHLQSSVQVKHGVRSASLRGRMIRAALVERVDASFLTWLTPTKLLLVLALLASLIVWLFFKPYDQVNLEFVDVVSAEAAADVDDTVDLEVSSTFTAPLGDANANKSKGNDVNAVDSLHGVYADSVVARIDDSADKRSVVDRADKFDVSNTLAIAQTAKIELELKAVNDAAKQAVSPSPALILSRERINQQPKGLVLNKVSVPAGSQSDKDVVPYSKSPKKPLDAVNAGFAEKPLTATSEVPVQQVSEVAAKVGTSVKSANANSVDNNDVSVTASNIATSNIFTSNNIALANNLTATKIARTESVVEAVPTTRELRELMIHFTYGYERGDIDAFMQIFTDDLVSDEPGGKKGFKQAYSALFDTTTSRVMVIQNLHWSKTAKSTIGLADYRIKTKLIDKSDVYDSHGTFRFEVVKVNDKAKIAGFYYDVAND